MKPYYEHAGITIYNGDCRDVLSQLSVVDAVITDPPYAIPTQVASGRNSTINVGDLSITEWYFRSLFADLWRLMGPRGQMFLFCDATFYPVLFRASYGTSNQSLLVWDKGQIGMGREFRKSHELILRLWGSGTPHMTDGKGHADVIRRSPLPSADRVHPAEKPTSLIADLLWCCGQVVLDPFMGSGSTLVAARAAGRRAVGIEIEERYCEIAARRLEQEMLPLGRAQEGSAHAVQETLPLGDDAA